MQEHYYTIIPAWIYKSDKLNPTDRELFGLINGLSGKQGYCYANNEYLAERLKISARTVQRTISLLRELNLIRIVSDTGDRKIYILNPDGVTNCHGGGDKLSWGGMTNCHPDYIIHKIDKEIDKKSACAVSDATPTTPTTVHPLSHLEYKEVPKHIDGLTLIQYINWLEYRKNSKFRRWTKQTELAALNKFKTGAELTLSIAQSISNGWQGLFPAQQNNYKSNFERNQEILKRSLAEIEAEKAGA